MTDSQKADQIAFHFYTKLFNVVNHARTTLPQPAKLDKWFNLETPDSDLFTKEARERYKSISVSPPPPPLEIQVLLTIPELTNNQVLVHVSPDSSRVRVDPTPRYVLLEEFILHFIPAHTPAEVPLPTIYKHGIPLFRSLFTLLRLLPAWKLHKRLRRRTGTGPFLGITLRVRQGPQDDSEVLSLMTTSQADTHTFPSVPHPLGSLALSATYLVHPTFQLDDLESLLSSRFLSLDHRPFTPTLAAKNHLRSSSTTTISSSSSPPHPHSRPLSRSPPRASNSHSSSGIPLPLPDRGAPRITPPRIASRPSSGPTSAQPVLSGLSSTRLAHLSAAAAIGPGTATTSTSGASSTSSLSPSNSFYGATTGGAAPIPDFTSASTSTTATPPTGTTITRPPSRPQPQYPFPFKSNTVTGSGAGALHVGSVGSSSSSPGGGVSLGSVGIPSSLGERVGLRYAGERDRVVSLPQQRAGGVHSRGSSVPVSGSGTAGVGVVPMSRTTSAKGRERGEDGGEQQAQVHAPGTSVPRKRYSSSFGHRYGSPLSGSVGSGGSGGGVGEDGTGKEREKEKDKQQPPHHPYAHPPHPHSPLSPHYSPSSSQMYMKAGNADDDEISVFVQDIDARKMLRGASRETSLERVVGEIVPRTSSGLGYEYGGQRRQPLFERGGEGGGVVGTGGGGIDLDRDGNGDRDEVGERTSGLILTSEREVDERLRRMNEVFWGSLEGLGGAGSGPTRSASASTSASGNGTMERGGGGVEPEMRFRSLRSGASRPTQGIAIPIPQAFRRQGEGSVEEVVGRMEEEAEEEGDEWGRGRGVSGGGGRSGGRYYMF